MTTTTYSRIQGTLTTELRSPRSPRKQHHHQGQQRQNNVPDKVIKCLECWNPNPKIHPCLFCKKCLGSVLQTGTSRSSFHTTRNQSKATAFLSPSNSFNSQDSDLTAWEKYRSQSARLRRPGAPEQQEDHHHNSRHGNHLRTPRTQEVIINSSLGIGDHDDSPDIHRDPPQQKHQHHQKRPDDRASKDSSYTVEQHAQRRRNGILRKKGHDFERTATHCGLCPKAEDRRRLVVYCVHCRKHLCQEHLDFHRRLSMFRPHATVNIQDGTNQGLV